MAQQLVHSLAVGSIYTLLVVGLTFIYGAQRSLCLAYGGLYSLGAYIAWWTMRSSSTVWLALLGAILLGAVSGWVLCWVQRLAQARQGEYSALLASMGLLICCEEIYRLGIRPYGLKVTATDSAHVYHLGPLMVTDRHWLVFGCTFALLTLGQGVLTTSRIGRALHMFCQDDAATMLPNASVRSLRLLASGLGAALAGVSGVLAALYFNDVYPAMGTRVMYKLLALVCIGSLGSLRGAIVGAFVLALLEGVQLPLLPSILPADAFLLLALAGVTGLFPRRQQRWQRGLCPSVSP